MTHWLLFTIVWNVPAWQPSYCSVNLTIPLKSTFILELTDTKIPTICAFLAEESFRNNWVLNIFEPSIWTMLYIHWLEFTLVTWLPSASQLDDHEASSLLLHSLIETHHTLTATLLPWMVLDFAPESVAIKMIKTVEQCPLVDCYINIFRAKNWGCQFQYVKFGVP